MAFTTEEVVLDAERGVTLSVQLLPTGGWYPGITERPVVLILPGGGYNRPSEREAENVAAPFLAAGYHDSPSFTSINTLFSTIVCTSSVSKYFVKFSTLIMIVIFYLVFSIQ